MHDIRWIRENREEFTAGLRRRYLPNPRVTTEDVLDTDTAWRAAETRVQEAKAIRNRLGRDIGAAKRAGTDIIDIQKMIEASRQLELDETGAATKLREQLDKLLAGLPNLPAPDVPDGPDESANQEIRRHGAPPHFDFPPLPHEAIGERLGLMDFARAAKLSGARFVVLKGALARLERALGQFMLDLHTSEFGYEEISPPLLVRDDALYGTTQLPKFAEDQFQTREGYWLIPTSEVPLTNLRSGETLDERDLPLRYTAWTPCFRSEAGAAGKDTRGMIRQHQFEKVELVSLTTPEQSEAEHERMTGCAEEVLRRLGLAYRVVMLSAGDMGFAAHKTYDIEVWLPGQNAYREISSCSNCGAFQARRMNTRYRPSDKGARPLHVHTLNGSSLAVGRTLIAILENFQRRDGSVAIPEALRPYMGREAVIGLSG